MEYKTPIKELRKKLVIFQEELTNILDVFVASVNRWENGKHETTIKIKRKILELCKKYEIIN